MFLGKSIPGGFRVPGASAASSGGWFHRATFCPRMALQRPPLLLSDTAPSSHCPPDSAQAAQDARSPAGRTRHLPYVACPPVPQAGRPRAPSA